RIPLRYPGLVHRGQGAMDSLCSFDRERLPGRPGCVPGWLSRRRTLYRPSGGAAVERDGLDDRRLVSVRPSGWPSGGATWSLVDQADPGDDRPPAEAQAASLVATLRLLMAQDPIGGHRPPSESQTPLRRGAV